MRRIALALLMVLWAAPALAAAPSTESGIPLDAPWKVTIYNLARGNFKHPAWGWQHSERNYRISLELAKGDGLRVDYDVLFAACFLHDMAAFPAYQGTGEHGDVAAEKSESLLRAAGFPMKKFPRVAAAMRGHMYYSDPGDIPEAIVLHDADSLDFLGAIGEARMLSLTGVSSESAAKEVAQLQKFVKEIPPKLLTRTGRKIGAERAAELQAFLDAWQRESFDGVLP